MKFKLLAFVAVLALANITGAHAEDLKLIQDGKLMIATEGTYPPFSMQSPTGELDGLEIRVMKEIAKRIGLTYEPVVTKWDSLLVGLAANQYDGISAAMDITPERQKAILFSDGWLESGGRIVTLEGSDIKSAADLKGKTVGALVASTWFTLADGMGASVKGYKSESDGLQDLANGNIDAVITDAVAAGYAIKTAHLPLVMTEDYVSHVQKGFAFNKDRGELVAKVNKALADMIADGTYAKLTTDLVGFDPHPAEPIRSMLQ